MGGSGHAGQRRIITAVSSHEYHCSIGTEGFGQVSSFRQDLSTVRTRAYICSDDSVVEARIVIGLSSMLCLPVFRHRRVHCCGPSIDHASGWARFNSESLCSILDCRRRDALQSPMIGSLRRIEFRDFAPYHEGIRMSACGQSHEPQSSSGPWKQYRAKG